MTPEELAQKFYKRASVSTEIVAREMGLAGEMLAGAAKDIAKEIFKSHNYYGKHGRIEDNIAFQVTESARLIKLMLGTRGGLPHAAAQEYGATMTIPEYFGPRTMRFVSKTTGNLVFTKHRRAYTVVLPERSYIRRAIKENEEEVSKMIDDAILRDF